MFCLPKIHLSLTLESRLRLQDRFIRSYEGPNDVLMLESFLTIRACVCCGRRAASLLSTAAVDGAAAGVRVDLA
jgi:hypothetical protein